MGDGDVNHRGGWHPQLASYLARLVQRNRGTFEDMSSIKYYAFMNSVRPQLLEIFAAAALW